MELISITFLNLKSYYFTCFRMAQEGIQDSLERLRRLINDENSTLGEIRDSVAKIVTKNCVEWSGWSPLVEAVKKNRKDILKVLVEEGFDINSTVKNPQVELVLIPSIFLRKAILAIEY